MADQVQEGDKVSWNWNGNKPSGTVAEVKAGEVSVTSHRGNEIKKTGDEENPAVRIERSGNDVVKKASELNIEEKGSGDSEKHGNDNEQNGESKEKEDEPKIGDKRKAGGKADADKKENIEQEEETEKVEAKDSKKQKTDVKPGNTGSTNGAKKGPGRPKSNGEKPAAKKEKKAPVVGRSERKTRSQGAA